MDQRTEDIIRNLHPRCMQKFRKLAEYLKRAHEEGDTRFEFRPFEGLRTPIKQEELFRQRPPVTHVGAWHSAHQYGLAVDFVPYNGSSWSWAETNEWQFLADAAHQCGLRRPFLWDKAHIEDPLWDELRPLVGPPRGKLTI